VSWKKVFCGLWPYYARRSYLNLLLKTKTILIFLQIQFFIINRFWHYPLFCLISILGCLLKIRIIFSKKSEILFILTIRNQMTNISSPCGSTGSQNILSHNLWVIIYDKFRRPSPDPKTEAKKDSKIDDIFWKWHLDYHEDES
jgi:hypothetical protein